MPKGAGLKTVFVLACGNRQHTDDKAKYFYIQTERDSTTRREFSVFKNK
jgi:hypothetical protein